MPTPWNWPKAVQELQNLVAAYSGGFDARTRDISSTPLGPYVLVDAKEASGVFPGVDAVDMAVSWERFPSVLIGMASNSEQKQLSRNLSVKLFEYERDRRTNEPREVAYEFSALYSWGGAPYSFALFYLIFRREKRDGCLKRDHRLEITGTACRLFGHARILEILLQVGLAPKKLKELHLAGDFFVEKERNQVLLFSNLAARADKKLTGTDFSHKGLLETVNVGEDDRMKNTYRFFRIYDKDADTIEKKKTALYPLGEKSRIRYEMELRKDKCNEMPWQWLLDAQKLKEVWEYEVRAFVKRLDGRIPDSWGNFHKVGRSEPKPDSYRNAVTKRLSDASRRNWAQAQGWLGRMLDEGASLADVVGAVIHFHGEWKRGRKKTMMEARQSRTCRRRPG